MIFDAGPVASLPYMSFIVPHLTFLINEGINHTFLNKRTSLLKKKLKKMNSWQPVVVSESGSDLRNDNTRKTSN